jgi:peroxiredoxin
MKSMMNRMPRKSLKFFGFGLTVAVTLTACAVPEGPPGVDDALPDLAYPKLEVMEGDVDAETGEAKLLPLVGDSVRFSDYLGDVVLVNLWATWCPPCRFETPYLQELFATYRDRGFHVVGVSTDSETAIDAVRGFTADNGVEYDILLDPSSESTGVFGAFGLPASLLVDRDGVIRWMLLGPILETDEEFLGALEQLLDAEPSSDP